MAQPLVLKTNAEPTWFNKEAAIGFFIAPLLGSLIGGWIGKQRMQDEKKYGKIVSDQPSFWNKDTLLGGLIGFALAGMAALASGVFAVVATASLPVGTMAAVLGLVGAPILGAYIGGKYGEKQQMTEYEQARQQTIVSGLSQNMSPEIAQAVEYRMAHDKQWGKQMLEDKLLAQAQENVRQ